MEERLEHLPEAIVVENRPSPAGTSAKDVTVGEAAACDEPLEICEIDLALDKIAHVNVDAFKAGKRKCRRHLDVTVDALLAKYRHAGL